MSEGRDPKNFLKLIESPGSVQDYYLFRMEGEEALSQPFSFRLTIRSRGDIPQASEWVGASITFQMGLSDDAPRMVNGQCVRFEHAYQKGQYVEFVLDISASLSVTKLNRDNRIFTAKTAKQVIAQILGEHDITFDDTKVKGVTRVREYCVQYDESDFDFISRLMQEEGVFYYFRYDEGAGRFKHKMTLADDPSGFFDGEPAKVAFRSSPLHPGLKSVGTAYAASTGGWLTNDYDFKKPTSLTPVKTASRLDYAAKSTRQYAWPGNGYAPDDVRRASKLAMEHQESGALAVEGQGKYTSFTPGARFEIDDTRLSPRERRIAIRTVSHAAFDPWGLEEGEPSYEQHFSAVPSDQPHRPERSTPPASVKGPQTGVVVDQVDPEGFGRIQVRFHWDHAGASTCWLRVAQQWAGGKIGAQFVPRPGMEVLVDYLEGDPDRPIVVACIYNGDNKQPYDTPAKLSQAGWRTMSHPSGSVANEFIFEDKAGAEEIYTFAGRNLRRVTVNDEIVQIGQNSALHVIGDSGHEVDGAHAMHVKGAITIKSDTSIVLSVGASRIAISKEGVVITAPMIDLN